MTNIKPAVETILSQRYTMTDNGISDTGIVIQVFEDEKQVDIFYSQNDEPIDQVIVYRTDMNDDQATDLTVRAIMALLDTQLRGEQLQSIVGLMKLDVMNPTGYDVIVRDVTENLVQRRRYHCDSYCIMNSEMTRFVRLHSGHDCIEVEISEGEDEFFCQRFDALTDDLFDRVLTTCETGLDADVSLHDIERVSEARHGN
ncbi:hypothetical protein [Aeromonas dhakensis]|uniref:hypothetical protein n=1 Tax=Aeromonas dhakensis TaxID=196024 RepID=UPI0038D23E03